MIMASQMPSGEKTPRFPKVRHQLIWKTQILQKNSWLQRHKCLHLLKMK